MRTYSSTGAGSDSPIAHDGPRILIVDDEPAIRRFLQISLTAHNYAILEATCGQEAINGVITQNPALLILGL